MVKPSSEGDLERQPELPAAAVSDDELRRLDAAYEPFPALEDWAVEVPDDHAEVLFEELRKAKEGLTEEQIRKAGEVAVRAAAVDTGALEGLYPTDRGLTIAIATSAAAWEAEADRRSTDIRRFFEAQLEAYELVLDAATGRNPVVEAWLRRLHEELCASQETYPARTPQGVQDLRLPKGEYKKLPNHVLKADGGSFSFAPVAETPSEMHRLVAELGSEAFAAAHPVVQAAYSHYALVRIHPFADGNGRVARALSSLYLYRAFSVPLVVFLDQREEYLSALEAADAGEPQSFVSFLHERTKDALRIFVQQLEWQRRRKDGDLDEVTQRLRRLYISHGEMKHQEVDQAAYQLVDLAASQLRTMVESLPLPSEIRVTVEVEKVTGPGLGEEFRSPAEDASRRITVLFRTAHSARCSIPFRFFPYIRRVEEAAALVLEATEVEALRLDVQISDIHPQPTKVLELSLASWAEAVIETGLLQIEAEVQAALKNKGYILESD